MCFYFWVGLSRSKADLLLVAPQASEPSYFGPSKRTRKMLLQGAKPTRLAHQANTPAEVGASGDRRVAKLELRHEE